MDLRNFLSLVRRLGLLQVREVARTIKIDSSTPDLTHWVGVWANALKPVMVSYWLTGMGQVDTSRVSSSRMDEDGRSYEPGNDSIFGVRKEIISGTSLVEGFRVGGVRRREEYPSPYVSTASHPTGPSYNQLSPTSHILTPRRIIQTLHFQRKNLVYFWKKSLDASKVTPRIMDAVDALTLKFCRETNETATKELREALDEVRGLLRKGLRRGEAVGLLAKRVGKIFADPLRAYRIVVTESSRALNAGQLMGARDGGYRKKVWVYRGGCERCKRLGGRKRLLDTPFWVNPGGGSYAVVSHPPLHPHCRCGMVYE